ncbi:hypothetical protein ABPG72_012486 [Tetrahymena utriculariae]
MTIYLKKQQSIKQNTGLGDQRVGRGQQIYADRKESKAKSKYNKLLYFIFIFYQMCNTILVFLACFQQIFYITQPTYFKISNIIFFNQFKFLVFQFKLYRLVVQYLQLADRDFFTNYPNFHNKTKQYVQKNITQPYDLLIMFRKKNKFKSSSLPFLIFLYLQTFFLFRLA